MLSPRSIMKKRSPARSAEARTKERLESTFEEQEAISPKKNQRQLDQYSAHRFSVTRVASVFILALFMLSVSKLQGLKEDKSSNVVVLSTSAHQDQAEQNEVNEHQATDNRAPDFGIIGYPKTGTTFLLDALNRHPEVVMPPKEFCELENWFEDMKNISATPQSPHKTPTPTRYGFKCPKMIRSTKEIENLVKIAKDKDTRLVMALRHPVLWFESFYN